MTPTHHQPLQQRDPFSRGPLRLGLVLMAHHHIPLQPLLVRLIAFKADIGRMMVANQDRPLIRRTPLMVDAHRAFGVETTRRLALAKDVGTSLDGIVQGAQNPPIGGFKPEHGMMPRTQPSHRIFESLVFLPIEHLSRAAEHVELIEHRVQCVHHRRITAHHPLPAFIQIVSCRRDGAELTALGLVPAGRHHALDRGLQLQLAHLTANAQ